ncbi:MAG: hypothetical protein IT305_23160 [Chloroflexi bacterium]|nr:hypothetical protein [Chloroflexota bacterium]
MNEYRRDAVGTIGLSAARVATAAVQQAARHERALLACLSELDGRDAPDDALVQAVRRRALRHSARAVGLVRTAIRLNPDPQAELLYAALLERQERNAMNVEQLPAGERVEESPLASQGAGTVGRLPTVQG